jgi:uncharacterized protein YdbL (DUF1318 family)
MIRINGQQSIIAYQYLRWLEKLNKTEIQAFYSKEGEKRIGRFSVDGYYEQTTKDGRTEKIIIEINGCDIHGCVKCFRNDDHWLPKVQRTAGQQRQKDAQRTEYLKNFVDQIIVKWPCKIRKEKKRNPNMKKFFEETLHSIEQPKNYRSTWINSKYK